jgi:uncharacterized protein
MMRHWRTLRISFGLVVLGYLVACGVLFLQQRQAIYRPGKTYAFTPDAPEFHMPYETVRFPVDRRSGQQLQGWWLPAPQAGEPLDLLPAEPRRIVKSPKVLLYLCGVGQNMGDHNYLTRLQALRQLGFSVLIFDYRGYGQSDGGFPHETQMYQDAQAAWDYLTQVRQIRPADIVLYGESLGGAIAIDLASQQPQAGALIVQSSFSSMHDIVQRWDWSRYFPIDLLLTERFDSIRKIKTIQMPVLLIHGMQDPVVPYTMSQTLYAAAPSPKSLWLVPEGGHVRIYDPTQSYLKAIAEFFYQLPKSANSLTP